MAPADTTSQLDGLAREAADAFDEEAYEEAVALAARGARAALRADESEFWIEFALLRTSMLNQLGRSQEALGGADEILRKHPDVVDAMLERGLALWELYRLDGARAQLLEVARRAPRDALAHHTLALIAERQGDESEAARRFARARRLAPGEFPEPIRLSTAEFDAVEPECSAVLGEFFERLRKKAQ